MDLTATGMLYLSAAEEIDGEPTSEYARRITETKTLLESCTRGLEFVLKGKSYSGDDFSNMQKLFQVMPELRSMEKPIEYLQEYSGALDSLLHGRNGYDKEKLVHFLDDLGSRYIHFDIARTRNCCN